MAPPKRLVSGQSYRGPSASAHNAGVDLWERRNDGTTFPNTSALEPDIIRIRNKSGADVDRWGVLGLDVPPILPSDNAASFANQPRHDGKTPTAAHVGKFAVLLEPIKNNAWGSAVVSGVTVAKLDIPSGTDTTLTTADIDPTTNKLTLLPGGSAEVLWIESSGTTRWAKIRIGPKQFIREPCMFWNPTTYYSGGSQTSITVSASPMNLVFADSLGNLTAAGITNLASVATTSSDASFTLTKSGLWTARLELWVEPAGSWVASGSGGTDGDTGTPRKQTYTTSTAGSPSHDHTVSSRVLMDPAVFAKIVMQVGGVNVGPQVVQRIHYLEAAASTGLYGVCIRAEWMFNVTANKDLNFALYCLNPASIGGNPAWKLPANTNARFFLERLRERTVPQTATP